MRLNRAVAVAEAQGPRAGLALLAGLDDVLRDNHRVAAVRAELAERAGDIELARASYRDGDRPVRQRRRTAHLRARLAETEPPTGEHRTSTQPSHCTIRPAGARE